MTLLSRREAIGRVTGAGLGIVSVLRTGDGVGLARAEGQRGAVRQPAPVSHLVHLARAKRLPIRFLLYEDRRDLVLAREAQQAGAFYESRDLCTAP